MADLNIENIRNRFRVFRNRFRKKRKVLWTYIVLSLINGINI